MGLDLNHRDATDLWLVGITQAECLSDISDVVSKFGARAVDYLTAIQYLNALRTTTASSKKSNVVLFPVQCVSGIEDIVRMNLRMEGKSK